MLMAMAQMTIYQKIKNDRARVRTEAARSAWERLSAFLVQRDVTGKLFGSLCDDRVHENSDIDVMILGDPSRELSREIMREADKIAKECGVPVDLMFERDFPELARSTWDEN